MRISTSPTLSGSGIDLRSFDIGIKPRLVPNPFLIELNRAIFKEICSVQDEWKAERREASRLCSSARWYSVRPAFRNLVKLLDPDPAQRGWVSTLDVSERTGLRGTDLGVISKAFEDFARVGFLIPFVGNSSEVEVRLGKPTINARLILNGSRTAPDALAVVCRLPLDE